MQDSQIIFARRLSAWTFRGRQAALVFRRLYKRPQSVLVRDGVRQNGLPGGRP
jgi:hypothetical protein